ncbi:MAG: hypothetical protein II937_08175 [Bacteroidales bacterium]|nr:hypothetical protein [Bacteroidales bacterium]
MENSLKGYCYQSVNQNVAYADFSDKEKGESVIFFNGKPLDKVPKDFVCGLKFYKSDLYVIYQRAVLRIKDIATSPEVEDDYTISMQDYYSYEYPQLIDFRGEKLYVSIGGRFFVLDEKSDKWIELAQFFIGDSPAKVTEDGEIIFSVNLQKDNDLCGVKVFDTKTMMLKFFSSQRKVST